MSSVYFQKCCSNSCTIFFLADVGYVQGMNDILSRFLIVLGSETEAYWCFVNYMETVKRDFLDDGMLHKVRKQTFPV